MIKKFIRGSEKHASKVKQMLLDMGGKNEYNWGMEDETSLYFIGENNIIVVVNENSQFGWLVKNTLEEIHLPEKQESKFDPSTLKPFDKVLACDSTYAEDTDMANIWRCDFFGRVVEDNKDYPYECIGANYKICIPFNDETAHLLGMCGQPPKFYDIWD